jgi:hypothetical protein
LTQKTIFPHFVSNFCGYKDRDDIALSETLKAIVNHLEFNREILRPVVPCKNMIESMPDEEIDTVIAYFKQFRNKAEEAVATGEKEKAHKIWRELFGDEFPKYKDEQKSNSAPIYTITRENKPWGN